jgi:hypothetical protein
MKTLNAALARQFARDLFDDTRQGPEQERPGNGGSEPRAAEFEAPPKPFAILCACGCGKAVIPDRPQASGKRFVNPEHKRRHERRCREAGQLLLGGL